MSSFENLTYLFELHVFLQSRWFHNDFLLAIIPTSHATGDANHGVFVFYVCWALPCEVVLLDLHELWHLGVEYTAELQMYEETERLRGTFVPWAQNTRQPRVTTFKFWSYVPNSLAFLSFQKTYLGFSCSLVLTRVPSYFRLVFKKNRATPNFWKVYDSLFEAEAPCERTFASTMTCWAEEAIHWNVANPVALRVCGMWHTQWT